VRVEPIEGAPGQFESRRVLLTREIAPDLYQLVDEVSWLGVRQQLVEEEVRALSGAPR
jgi:hypothetical protein